MKKIPINSEQKPLQSPFSGLDPSNFPDAAGPAESTGGATPPPPARGPRPRVILRREKAARGGKTVVVAHGFPTHLGPPDLENLLKKARKSLGCGGRLAGREIELQGDQAGRVRAFFESQGYMVTGPG